MKQTLIFVVLALSFVFLFSACTSDGEICCDPTVPLRSGKPENNEPRTYHKITSEEAKNKIGEGGVTVVDVRTAEEYAEKHIPGAILVPLQSIGKEPPEALPDKNAILLVYCRTGIRSKQASDKLSDLGYTQIYDFGGIADWPYETESGAVN